MSEELLTVEQMCEQYNIGDDKMVLDLDGDGWRAICSPDIESGTNLPSKHGAPFNFAKFGDAPSDEELGERFGQKFEDKVEEVWELIDDSDDPLNAIMDLNPQDLTGRPRGQE